MCYANPVRLECFFFLLSRQPPRFTLFPYTTLFRSGQRPGRKARRRIQSRSRRTRQGRRRFPRSEEHTSELQSLAYLVCRLLLEKKKKLLFLFFVFKKKHE